MHSVAPAATSAVGSTSMHDASSSPIMDQAAPAPLMQPAGYVAAPAPAPTVAAPFISKSVAVHEPVSVSPEEFAAPSVRSIGVRDRGEALSRLCFPSLVAAKYQHERPVQEGASGGAAEVGSQWAGRTGSVNSKGAPEVVLEGLRTAGLNGCRGRAIAFDHDRRKFQVHLQEGQTVWVDMTNVRECDSCPEALQPSGRCG